MQSLNINFMLFIINKVYICVSYMIFLFIIFKRECITLITTGMGWKKMIIYLWTLYIFTQKTATEMQR